MINRQLVHFDTAGQRVILNPGQLVNTGGDYYDVASGGGGGSPGYYGSFYDTTDQTAAAINTGYPITLNTTVENNGVSIVSGSRITVANGGVYNIQFSAQFVNTVTSIQEVTLWLKLNGTNIAYSSGAVSVPNSHGGTHGQIIAAWNYVMTLSASDYLQFYWQTPNTGVYIEKVIDGAAPISPSMIVTVTQVASTVAGPTGPAGNSVLNGVVAPSGLTGNNGDFYINTATNYLYGPKAAGVWPAGTPLTAGTGPAGGDLTGTYPNPTLAAITTAATKGTAAKTATVTIDAKGRVTSITDQDIAITKAQAGLSNVDNTADATKSVLFATTAGGAPPTGSASGDLTGTYPGPTLAVVTTAQTLGSATKSVTVTIDAKGRVTAMTENTITATDATKLPLAGGTMTGALVLRTGSATAGTSPLKFVSGSLMTAPEIGALEFLTDDLLFTISTGTARKRLALCDASLTSGRVPFATTNGRLTDSANLTYTDATAALGLTLTQSARTALTVTNSSANAAAEAGTAATTGAGTVFFGTGSSASSKVAGGMIYTADAIPLTLWTNGLRRLTVTGADGNVGIGVASGTAYLHIKAGTATGGTAPLKINSGTVMSSPEDGAVEYNGTKWYTTIGTDRQEIVRGATYSPTLTPSAVAANSESIQTFTISGLIVPYAVSISPPASMSGLGIMWARVSASSTLEVGFRNFTAGSLTPPSGTWRIMAARN